MLMMSGFGGRTLPEVFKARGVEVWRKPIRIQHLIDRVAFLLTSR